MLSAVSHVSLGFKTSGGFPELVVVKSSPVLGVFNVGTFGGLAVLKVDTADIVPVMVPNLGRTRQ